MPEQGSLEPLLRHQTSPGILQSTLRFYGCRITCFTISNPGELLENKPVVGGRRLLFLGIKRVPFRAGHLDSANRAVCVAEIHDAGMLTAELIVLRVLNRQPRDGG